MDNKLKYKLIFLLFIMTQLVSCQDKNIQGMEDGFYIKDKKLYYNQKNIALGIPVDQFVDAFGKYDRKVEYSTGGGEHSDWFWTKKMFKASTSTNESGQEIIILAKMRIDEETGKPVEDYNGEYKEFSNINDVIKMYGKYDSISIDKSSARTSTFYVWDKLGINAAEANGVISTVNLYPLHVLKTMDLDLATGKTFYDGAGNAQLTQEMLEDRKNDKAIFDRMPKQEFKGKFSYNGNTIDFSKIGNTDWNNVVSGLKISGSDFDPAGDSEKWSREIRESYDLYITINRYSNAEESGKLSVKKIGKYDTVGDISIWQHTTDEGRK
ncbi:hypothetical protein SAMN05421786_10193 [Chryseobacterium ureilyticum]|uniref:DUF7738 domain-containing protein n=1 Tax=Chryseobacterium ureilyticum TaxID=373668 RepID=A0A1N7JWC6_9FLAO|nr:hypothetical protein [Chryseobacterium ureilyticum]SIS53649.1 hypothetical protein SAMN05421786_10193 [Chryseobacterium ureilyticum]